MSGVNMSTLHLTTGSVEPPKVEGLLRLYSNVYCPYAQRTRLVLKHKGLPHDIVNINLTEKPGWYFKINSQGKVPSLLIKDQIIIESLDISDLLDQKYPEKPLYPADPEAKKKDKELIGKIAPVTNSFFQWISKNELTPEEVVKDLAEVLQPFEDELAKRGTTFFGGEQPGMVDYMLWPWIERAGVLPIKFGISKLPFKEGQLPNFRKWKSAMLDQPVVKEILNTPEKFWELFQSRITGSKPNYDK